MTVRFLDVTLQAPPGELRTLADFYVERLGLERLPERDGSLAVRVGETRLELTPGPGRPFYHVALLVPGDRFEDALAWVSGRTEVLAGTDGRVVFDFAFWDALACYFHDPAGNIVELIAHRGVGETAAGGPFSGRELLGLSELGLVGDPAELAAGLARIGLELWSGSVGEGGLAFVGERARTLILSPEGRPWLPTGRPSEPHPVEATVSGDEDAEAAAGGHLIRRRAG